MPNDDFGVVKYSFGDLLRIQDLLGKEEADLSKRLGRLRNQLKAIAEILALNRNRDETFEVFLPKSFFEINEGIRERSHTSKKFNWKKVTYELLVEYNGLVTTNMIYEMARIKYPSEMAKRQEAIRNFSSALYSLVYYNGKLMRFKEEGTREFIYGLLDHFDEIGKKPKDLFMNKFRRQRKN